VRIKAAQIVSYFTPPPHIASVLRAGSAIFVKFLEGVIYGQCWGVWGKVSGTFVDPGEHPCCGVAQAFYAWDEGTTVLVFFFLLAAFRWRDSAIRAGFPGQFAMARERA